MDASSIPPKRKRSQHTDLHSRYFSSSVRNPKNPGPRSQSDAHHSPSPPHSEHHQLLVHTTSRFFHPNPDLDALLAHPPFPLCYHHFLHAILDLYCAKPLLIQDHVSYSPWKVLIAVTLLNKTSGPKAIPVFFHIIQRWPTPAALADAPFSLLFEILNDLGLGHVRSQRLIDISQSFLDRPPQVDKLHPSRGKYTALITASDGSFHLKKLKYPPTPISHIPGCGPYALDSYRIFCAGRDEWKNVRPSDKELVKYLQWRWAVDAFRKWDQALGPGDSIDLDYVRALNATLTINRAPPTPPGCVPGLVSNHASSTARSPKDTLGPLHAQADQRRPR